MQPSFLPPDVEGFRPDVSDINDINSGWHISRTEVPSNLDDFQEDLTKLLAKDDMSVGVAQGSSSTTLQAHQNGVESSARGTTDEMNNDQGWTSYISEGPAGFSEAATQSRFAQFPSTAEDEERMIMEAIAASLQDTNITGSRASDSQDNASNPQAVSSPTLRTAPQGDLPAIPSDDNSAASHSTDQQRKQEELPPTSDSQTVGTLEALGQRWGLGLFRAMSSKQNNNSQS